MSEANKAIVRRVIDEALNQKKLAVLDEILAASFAYHGPMGRELKGSDGMKSMMSMYLEAFPDLRMTVEDQIADGDKVVTRWKAQGTNTGKLEDMAPSGRRCTITGIVIDRLVGGKIVEEWENFDEAGMMQQLGVLPAQAKA